MSHSDDGSDDFVTLVINMTRYLKTMQPPISQEERLSLSGLYSQLMEMLEEPEAACATCGSTDGFHTEDACLETA